MSQHSYIAAARRSPIGRFLGGFARTSAVEIGIPVAEALLADSRTSPADLDEVLVGMVLQAGAGQNPARQVALGAGCENTISCSTINKVCGSGLQTVMSADQIIRCGDADLIMAGGIESMSTAPFLAPQMRSGNKFGDARLVDCLQFDGLVNIYDGDLMGVIAEETAGKHNLTREAQDEYAARSHQLTARAQSEGWFDDEIVPVPPRKGKEPVTSDEGVRAETTVDKLGLLRPAFAKDGTVTAGNASQLSDGAAMTLVASEAGLKKTGATPLARIVGHTTSGMHPREVFVAPIPACRMLLEKVGWSLDDVDVWEINEAFASELLAVEKVLELPREKINIHGGAIAIGHPLGASGTRCLVTALHALKRTGGKKAVVSLCLGGGNAVAIALEACS